MSKALFSVGILASLVAVFPLAAQGPADVSRQVPIAGVLRVIPITDKAEQVTKCRPVGVLKLGSSYLFEVYCPFTEGVERDIVVRLLASNPFLYANLVQAMSPRANVLYGTLPQSAFGAVGTFAAGSKKGVTGPQDGASQGMVTPSSSSTGPGNGPGISAQKAQASCVNCPSSSASRDKPPVKLP